MDVHFVTPKMGRKAKFVLSQGIDGSHTLKSPDTAVPVEEAVERGVGSSWDSKRTMEWIIFFLAVLVILLTIVIIFLTAPRKIDNGDSLDESAARKGGRPLTDPTTTTEKSSFKNQSFIPIDTVSEPEAAEDDGDFSGDETTLNVEEPTTEDFLIRRHGFIPIGFVPGTVESEIIEDNIESSGDGTTLEVLDEVTSTTGSGQNDTLSISQMTEPTESADDGSGDPIGEIDTISKEILSSVTLSDDNNDRESTLVTTDRQTKVTESVGRETADSDSDTETTPVSTTSSLIEQSTNDGWADNAETTPVETSSTDNEETPAPTLDVQTAGKEDSISHSTLSQSYEIVESTAAETTVASDSEDFIQTQEQITKSTAIIRKAPPVAEEPSDSFDYRSGDEEEENASPKPQMAIIMEDSEKKDETSGFDQPDQPINRHHYSENRKFDIFSLKSFQCFFSYTNIYVIPRGTTGDEYNLADNILRQALVGPSPNPLLLTYLKHSLSVQVVSYSAVFQSLCTHGTLQKPRCVTELLLLLKECINYVACSGSVEQCTSLASSLQMLKSWLFSMASESLTRLCDRSSSNEDFNIIICLSTNLLEMLYEEEFLVSMCFIGLCINEQSHSHLLQMCSQMESNLNQWVSILGGSPNEDDIKLVDRIKFVIGRCQTFEEDLFREKQTNKSLYDNSLCTDVHTLVSWEALLRPTSDGQELAQKLDVLQKLRDYSATQLYCEILRACCLGLAETADSSGELRWAVFTFLKAPTLLLRLHRAIHGLDPSAPVVEPSAEVASAFERLLCYPGLLETTDAKCHCNVVDGLLNEVKTRTGLLSERHVTSILGKRRRNKEKDT
nr:EOG090X01FD [Sida crystallina]